MGKKGISLIPSIYQLSPSPALCLYTPWLQLPSTKIPPFPNLRKPHSASTPPFTLTLKTQNPLPVEPPPVHLSDPPNKTSPSHAPPTSRARSSSAAGPTTSSSSRNATGTTTGPSWRSSRSSTGSTTGSTVSAPSSKSSNTTLPREILKLVILKAPVRTTAATI